MTRSLRAWRLAPAAACGWVSATIATSAVDIAWILSAVGAGLTVVLLLAALRWRVLMLVVVALVAGTAVSATVLLAAPARAAVTSVVGTGGRSVEVVAVVVGKAERFEDRVSVDIRTVSFQVGETRTHLDVPAVMRADAGVWPDDATLGARVVLRATANAAEPGAREAVELRARNLRVEAPPTGILSVAASLRGSLRSATEGLPQPGAGLIPGLAVGDTWDVAPALDDDMKTASLTHLTAVSGANCAIVVGAAFGLAALLGARRGVRVLAGVIALTGFVVLVTPEPSVVRAAVMAGIAMLAVLLGRSKAGIALLSVAVVVCLIIDPWLAGSLGFALSTAATGALLVLARPLSRGLERALPRPLALAIAVPLAAEIVCAPILLVADPSISLWGVPANLLAGPAAPVATVIGLLACLAAPIPILQSGLTAIAWLPAAWISGIATTIGDFPSPRLPWMEGVGGAVLLSALAGSVWLLVARRGHVVVRRAAGIVVVTATGVLAGTIALAGIAAPLTVPQDGAVIACDVGQGDAVVIRSAGRTALFDVGPEPEPLARCLAALRLDRIDLLVLSHFDLDHVGGLTAVIGKVGAVVHGPIPDTAADRMLAQLRDGGAAVTEAGVGMTGTLGASRWRVLWPRAVGVEPGNDASVVVDIRGPDVPPTLLLGDLGAEPQAALRASGLLGSGYRIVKVAHHGSADQDAALYRALHAPVAIFTVGAENRYRHPRDEALQILRDTGAEVLRTDADGMIVVTPQEGAVRIWRERSPPEPRLG